MAKTATRASGAERVERGRNGAPKTMNDSREINLKEDRKTISINPEDLVAKLHEVESSAHGDIARVIELLLVENHVLKGQQSSGLLRGVSVRYHDFPRFLKFEDEVEEQAVADIEQS